MKYFVATALVCSVLMLTGCGSSAPDSFFPMTKQLWESVPVDKKITYDDAWQRVIYIVTKKFELEMISKEDGYVRSAYSPSYFSEEIGNHNYHVRIVAKFTPDRSRLEFKIEAQVYDGKYWENGSDTRIAANMKRDLEYSLSPRKPAPKKPAVKPGAKQSSQPAQEGETEEQKAEQAPQQ